MLLPGGGGGGGGTESRSLEPSGESREGGGGYERGDEPPLIRGVRGPPQIFFSKYMYLRTHFIPWHLTPGYMSWVGAKGQSIRTNAWG